MYLRASDKVSGVENFQSAVGSKPIRREMVTKALRQGLSPRHGLEAEHFRYAKTLEKPLAVGLLGAGQQGLRLLKAVNSAYISVKAVADIRPSNKIRAIKTLLGTDKAKAQAIGDEAKKEPSYDELTAAAKAKGIHVYDSYEKLLAAAKADGLEAVIIALPSYLHAPAALAAMNAGLHVFVETPMALKVSDAKEIARKAAEKNLVLAVGQQRRYNWIYDHALEMVRLNLLNDVHYIRSQWHLLKPEKKPAGGRAAKKDDKKKPKEEAEKPDEFKIDWWQDVSKDEASLKFDGYDSPLELVRWQLYDKYSGGLLAELGSQLFAAAAMFVAATPNRDPERPYPLNVAGSGSQILKDAAGDIDDHVHCVFEYAIQGYVDDKSIPLQGPQEDRPAVRSDHRQRIRRLRRNGPGPGGIACARERAEADALPYVGRQQEPPRGGEEGWQESGCQGRAGDRGAQGRQGRRRVAGHWPAGLARGRCGLRRGVGALGLLLQAVGGR